MQESSLASGGKGANGTRKGDDARTIMIPHLIFSFFLILLFGQSCDFFFFVSFDVKVAAAAAAAVVGSGLISKPQNFDWLEIDQPGAESWRERERERYPRCPGDGK